MCSEVSNSVVFELNPETQVPKDTKGYTWFGTDLKVFFGVGHLLHVYVNFNPIPAGVLENQDMLGGDPPSKSHVLCPNMTNDTSLESSCALLLESAKKLQICKN